MLYWRPVRHIRLQKIVGADKVIVVGGVLERGGKVRTQILENRELHILHALVRDNVESGSQLSTDDCHSYGDWTKNMLMGSLTMPKST
jgi:hypothetical protein